MRGVRVAGPVGAGAGRRAASRAAICFFTISRAASTAGDTFVLVVLVAAKSRAVEASATQPMTRARCVLGARAGGAVSCCSSSSAGSILVVLGSPFVSRAEMPQPGKTGETLAWMEAAGPRARPGRAGESSASRRMPGLRLSGPRRLSGPADTHRAAP